jgi:serine/threonine protein kinase
MDKGILKKLNKVEHSNEYGYDEKADIWSLGTLCYEMLVGRNVFDAESMKDLLNKVNKGDYLLPTNISKEAVSFINGMLQYDSKKRLSAEKLYRHKFLNKRYDQLNKIDLSQIKGKVRGGKMRINTKLNQSIWDVFGDGTCSVILEDYDSEDFIEPANDIKDINNIEPEKPGNEKNESPPQPKIIIRREPTKQDKLSEKALGQEFMNVFEMVNEDFIFIAPKLIPIIPGDDPDAIKKITDDNF